MGHVSETTDIQVVELAVCQSTQHEVRERLTQAAGGEVVAVRAGSQLDGRGREQRSWQDPPGEALLLSVGARGPLPIDVLSDLPRRIVDALLEAIEALTRGPVAGRVAWKSPNDLVDAQGAKLGGVLVDARTVGEHVEVVIVGMGCNVTGGAFATRDGRRATTVEAALGETIDTRELATGVTARVAALLGVNRA
ncbi:MAG: biotin/acetyl-CoA-carboxylase ligase [Thermoleophilia bacterium]|nr:biotin/acetyl-CoA-carboxylase ligase [Thermoleophilia bacterium]